MQTYDVIVIGSGPAGQRAGIQAAKCGKRVALIEKREVIGGTCINTGTIPSKTMREAVLHLSGYYYQNIYGVNYRVKDKITIADLAFRVQHVIKTETDVTQAQLARNGIEVVTGAASFLDPHHIRVQNSRGHSDYEASFIFIATGQAKGFNLQAALASGLRRDRDAVPVLVFNDADVMAAGIAATQGQLHRMIRVWTLGEGIGYGRYPAVEGVWEGGHTVVTLDPKENFCGCGGVGHLEGIMGHRGIRLRFLDLEPEEVFENARRGDDRCARFLKFWHRALAAATATSIHMEGPGKFFISGANARYVDLGWLNIYLGEMVKMSPLQGSLFEIISTSDEIGIIGAAVNAERAAFGRSQE